MSATPETIEAPHRVAPLRLARSPERRARRMEHRHDPNSDAALNFGLTEHIEHERRASLGARRSTSRARCRAGGRCVDL